MDIEPLSSESITDNVVVDNHLTSGAEGGGIFVWWSWPQAARRNVVTDNQSNGIFMFIFSGGQPMNLGDETNLGFNVLMRNGDHDLVVQILGPACSVQAVGNYLGYLDTRTISERISSQPAGVVLYDPVAASGRWFSVEGNSFCETDVVVTGDLRIEPDVELQIAPGKKLEFCLTPDHSEPGGPPNLCELIVKGPSGSLKALGTPEDTIVFRSKRYYNDPWMPGDWYGIRLEPQSRAEFEFCEIYAAYCGVHAEPDAYRLNLANSYIHANLYAGVLMSGDSGVIEGNNISYNEVYGIRMELVSRGAVRISDNQIKFNPIAGISVKGTGPTDAPYPIIRNIIQSGYVGPVRSLCGIELLSVGSSVNVEDNPSIYGFHQAGINEFGSSAPLRSNTILGNTYYGICCGGGSTPLVRRNTVNYNAVSVFSDQTSLPNLGVAPDDGGYNSILMENYIYVENQNEETLCAQLNWWGTQNPDPNKFIGPVKYEPWLNQPPEGQQSSGKIEVIPESNLYDCHPNPFSNSTIIRYQIAKAGNVCLNIYDPGGRLVKILLTGEQKPGSYSVVWDGRDRNNQQVANGVYFYRFSAPDLRAVKKLILSR